MLKTVGQHIGCWAKSFAQGRQDESLISPKLVRGGQIHRQYKGVTRLVTHCGHDDSTACLCRVADVYNQVGPNLKQVSIRG